MSQLSPSFAPASLAVAIAGFGTIGEAVADKLREDVPGVRLCAIASRDVARARAAMVRAGVNVPVMAAAELPEVADAIVECAPAAAFREIAVPAIEAGRILVPLSAGALLDCPDLIALARERGARIIVPTGALLGLDAVRAAAEGRIHSVRIVTRKPPGGLAGAPYLRQRGIDISALDAPLRLFKGTAREGVAGFPANVNVVAALSLAGIGADQTQLEIWADPGVDRNMHRIEVDADSARFSMKIENVPSETNAATGRITPLSVVACLRGLVATLRIGS